MIDIERNDTFLVIMLVLMFIFFITITTLAIAKYKGNRESYIQKLEEKLNIYRESYEEFCLEDSLKQ